MTPLFLFATVLFGIISAWVFKVHGCNNSLSLSMHVAKSKTTSLIFGIFGSIATTAAAIVVFSQILPSTNASLLAYIIFFVLFIQFFVTVLFPHIEESKIGSIHNIAAWGMAFNIPVATAALLFTDLNIALRILTAVTLLVEIVLISIALGSNIVPKRSNFLYYQLAYVSLFFSYLLIMSWNL
jgi:hypothetical protein